MKVLISDYDQTFFTSLEGVEQNRINVEKFRKKGNLFIIATGRGFEHFKFVVNKHNLEYDFAIINHGATILDSNDNIISNITIDNNILKNLEKDLELDKSLDRFYCKKFKNITDFESDLTKINVKYKEKEDYLKVINKIKNKYSDYINLYDILNNKIELISNKTSKYLAAKTLIDKLNINKKDVYSIGDGYSDIEMVKNFNGYCMKNSVSELKEVATKEYDSVSELLNEIM